MKAITLARVSDKEQEDRDSLPAQADNFIKYCDRHELVIIKQFELVESSTRGNRTKFNEVIEFIKKQPETVALVVDRVDRLQRGFKETVIFDELMQKGKVVLHFIRENLIISENSKGPDIIRWDYAVMAAKTYILQLRDNVNSTKQFKLSRGECVTQAPTGYLNVTDPATERNTVVIDKDRAPFVKKTFELYSTGLYSYESLAVKLAEEGFTNKRGNSISKNSIGLILQNKFYYGIIVHKAGNNTEYPHNYPKIITKGLYDDCMEVAKARQKTPTKYILKPYAFRGLIRCAHCGCTISFETHKGKYVYSRCNKSKGNCPAGYVREEILLSQVSELLKKLAIPNDVLVDLKLRLQKSSEAEIQYHKHSIATLRREYDQIQQKLHNLLDLCIAGSITKSQYDEKASELKQIQYNIDMKLKEHTKADEEFGITVSYLMELASKAYKLFESSKVEQKHRILKLLLSKITLEGEKLYFKVKSPFEAIINAKERCFWGE